MRSFFASITITLLLSLFSKAIATDSQHSKNPPKDAKSESDSYSGLLADPVTLFDEYVPSLDYDFDVFAIRKRSEHKNTHGFYCGNSKHGRKFYQQNHINDAATKACAELGMSPGKRRKHLKPFEATVYQRFQGPYYEYPIHGKHKKRLFGKKRKNKYPNSVIINTQCEIVDVVSKNADFHYQQCDRGWH